MSKGAFPGLVVLMLILGTACKEDSGSESDVTALTAATHSYFPITSDSAHSATTCNDCHGTFDTFTQFSCLDGSCHVQAETVSNHGGVTGFAYESASCYTCHSDGTASGSVADHDLKFPISTGTHSGIACTACHLDSNNRTILGCITCHSGGTKPSHDDQAATTSAHSGITGFEYTSSACYGCHPQGSASGTSLNHDSFFPTSAGKKHAGIACDSCHADANDRAVLLCANATCHPSSVVNPIHPTNVIPGYTYDSSACYSCHPKGTADSAATVNHANIFQRGAGTVHAVSTSKIKGPTGAAGSAIHCSQCHSDRTTWTAVVCTTCHTSTISATDHTRVRASIATRPGGYVWSTADCLSCHANPSPVFSVSSHNNCVTHSNARCRTCHNVNSVGGKPFPTTDFNQKSCTACHANRGTDCND